MTRAKKIGVWLLACGTNAVAFSWLIGLTSISKDSQFWATVIEGAIVGGAVTVSLLEAK